LLLLLLLLLLLRFLSKNKHHSTLWYHHLVLLLNDFSAHCSMLSNEGNEEKKALKYHQKELGTLQSCGLLWL